jgi:hypothetical protein
MADKSLTWLKSRIESAAYEGDSQYQGAAERDSHNPNFTTRKGNDTNLKGAACLRSGRF